jgi:YebC/PmpR family DNA-binding regulatory protein
MIKTVTPYEEIMYEGYGPKGVAMMIETVTDNRNRSVSEIRHALSRSGGSMGELGSVSWQFERKAYLPVPASELDYDKAFELAIEAGADDVHEDEDMIEIVGPVESFKAIADLLHKAKVNPEDAGLRMVPKQEMELDVNDALQVLKVIESLEEMDDVQNVYSNLKMSEEALAALEAE